jgi:hypothetical protein
MRRNLPTAIELALSRLNVALPVFPVNADDRR